MGNRDGVRFDNIDRHDVTFVGDASLVFDRSKPFGSALVNAPVKVTGDSTVGAAVNDDTEIIGALQRIEPDGKVVVHVGRFVEFKGTPAAGSRVVGAASNAVKAGASGAGVGHVVQVLTSTCIVQLY